MSHFLLPIARSTSS